LDLLHTPELIDFFLSNAIRGGVSTVCRKKHLVANNSYMGDLYNNKLKDNYILYLDVTNLYGHSMIQMLPEGDFEFLNDLKVKYYLENVEELFKFADKYNIGFILEVDLEYPITLHELHIDLPFAPEHLDGKLSPNFFDKKNYKIHIKHLKLCLKHGLLLKNIHKIISFSQKEWLKPFIEKNTLIRKVTKNASEKDQAKLMNNSIFGKSMENILGRPNFKLMGKNDIKKIIKYLQSPDFLTEFIINENMVLLEMQKKTIVFDKPTYTGFTILELSKCWLYELIYDVIKPNFANATLSYIDTDSCIFETSQGNICNKNI
jgi:hypothetical protein